jgi:hypothetical protein
MGENLAFQPRDFGTFCISEARHGNSASEGASIPNNSVILIFRLRQQPIVVGDMPALQRFELLKDRSRNRAIETFIFVT